MAFRAFSLVCRSALGAALLFLAAPLEGGFVVDGDLSDWGVTNATLSTWSIGANSSGTGFGDGFQFQYIREDSSNSAGDSGFVGPNQGGQNYDSEFLAVGETLDHVVIAIVTGQRPDNGFARFAPGDIRISTTTGLFGVEVGGGVGGGPGDPITEGAPGSTYTLNSSGFTTAHAASPADSQHKAGSVWLTQESDWILDPIMKGTPPFAGLQPVQLQFTGGVLQGTADFIYTRNSVTTKHAIIELAIPRAVFQNSPYLTVQWAPACGNDVLYVGTPLHTPEPAGLTLSIVGLVCAAGLRRRRRSAICP